MNITKAQCALERTAQMNGVSVNQVYKEIEIAISEAMESNDKHVQAMWAKIPCSGDRPTPVELVAFLGELLSN